MPVVSVNESQVIDPAGNLSDVYEIVFTIEGQPGSFTTTVPKSGDPVAAASAAIDAQRAQVLGIYGL